MAKFQIIPDRFFQLASKQKPLFNLTKRVQRRLLRQLPWQQSAAAAVAAARPGQRAKRERENTCKNFFGGPSMSRILHYSLPG